MKKFIILFSLAVVSNVAFSQQQALTNFVDSIAGKYLKQNHGLALMIGINNHGTEQIFSYGETEKGNHQKPDARSIFEIGGITETFTSALFADLAIHGKIHMDDQVQKFLPVEAFVPVYRELICKPSAQSTDPDIITYHEHAFIQYTHYICLPDASSMPQPILLCYLSTHTSGLPEFPFNLNRSKNRENPYADYTKENLYDFLVEYRLDKPIGVDYNYSMVGISLLGHALELNAKTSFDSLLTQRLLMPMGLADTRINLTDEQQKHLLNGHNAKGNPVQHWTYQVLAPAGALHSSAADMMRFLDRNIRLEKDSLTNLLDYTHNARLKITGKKEDQEIALGWKINPLGIEEQHVVWQSGLTGGFSSYIGFVETTHTGIVILSNSSVPVNDIAKEILRKVNSTQMK